MIFCSPSNVNQVKGSFWGGWGPIQKALVARSIFSSAQSAWFGVAAFREASKFWSPFGGSFGVQIPGHSWVEVVLPLAIPKPWLWVFSIGTHSSLVAKPKVLRIRGRSRKPSIKWANHFRSKRIFSPNRTERPFPKERFRVKSGSIVRLAGVSDNFSEPRDPGNQVCYNSA